MNTYVILRRNGWSTASALEKAASRSARVGHDEMSGRVRWIRSYVLREPNGMLGTLCIFQGTDAGEVREHAERAGLPCDEIIAVVETVLIDDDPLPESGRP